jgi:methyl-accepting chemotaxis protein
MPAKATSGATDAALAEDKVYLKEWKFFLEDIDIARERAITPASKELAARVLADAKALRDMPAPPPEQATALGKALKKMVEAYLADGFQFRLSAEKAVDDSRRNLMIVVVIGAVLMIAIGIALERSVTPGLRKAIAIAGAIADGKLDNEIQATGRDEAGRLLIALDRMQSAIIESIRRDRERAEETAQAQQEAVVATAKAIGAEINIVVESVYEAAEWLQSTSETMAGIAERTSEQSNQVASSSEQACVNAETAAAASEQLSASIGEIGQQTEQARHIVRDAQDKVQRTIATVRQLDSATRNIEAVVSLINDIASKTNLLALNATIEAARAGEAGKGFAVVASEVKGLVNQTATATKQITDQLAAIQQAADDTANQIGEISEVVEKVSEATISISSAIEEQNAATGEIVRSVDHAAQDSRLVSGAIVEVNQGANETKSIATAALDSSRALVGHCQRLQGAMSSFDDKLKAS